MKFRKIIALFSLILSMFFTVSCAALKFFDDDYTDDVKKTETKVEKNKKSEKEKNKKADKSDKMKEPEKAEKTEKAKMPLSSELSADYGIIKLKANKNLGSFGIDVINQKNWSVPVLSGSNEYTKNGFWLKIDDKIYKLFSNGPVKAETSETDTGLKFTYHIKDTVEVNVNMDCVTSVAGKKSDMVKITARVVNLNEKTSIFSLKSVLDTVLGESGIYHFYTREDNPVKVETLYRGMKEEKWIMSKNEKAAMQILLDGGDTTPVEAVVLGNYSTVVSSDWFPKIKGYKTFDTILSYNDSSVGIIWPEIKLEQFDDAKYVFYLAFATDDHKPTGDKFIYGGRTEEPVVEVKVPVPQEKQPVPVIGNYETKDFTYSKFDPNNLSKKQLTPEYVQALVDRIEAMEDSGEAMNRDELLQLNEELDAILEVLRH